MLGGLFAVHEFFRCGVPEDNVADLVECGLMGECSKGIYRDFAPVRKALNVAIHFVKRRARDVQCSEDRKSTRLNSSHRCISYAVFCLKKKKKTRNDGV